MFNPRRAEGSPLVVFSKILFSQRERVKPCFFVTFNLIISHIFPESFIDNNGSEDMMIFIFDVKVLTILVNFSDFLAFWCYKETNDVRI